MNSAWEHFGRRSVRSQTRYLKRELRVICVARGLKVDLRRIRFSSVRREILKGKKMIIQNDNVTVAKLTCRNCTRITRTEVSHVAGIII